MVIRKLEAKDAEQVALLIPQLTKNIIEPENLARRIRDLPSQPHSQFFVVENAGLVVGFGGLAWYVIPSKGLIAWVEEIVVDISCRGRGYSRALMQCIAQEIVRQNIKQVKLTTGTPEAAALYRSLGFVKKDQDYFVKTCV